MLVPYFQNHWPWLRPSDQVPENAAVFCIKCPSRIDAMQYEKSKTKSNADRPCMFVVKSEEIPHAMLEWSIHGSCAAFPCMSVASLGIL